MSNVPISPEQRNAEAARHYSLRWLIVDLRRALHAESSGTINSSRVMGSVADLPKDTDEGGIGPPLSSWMHAFLGSSMGRDRKGWDLSPNPRRRPAMASIVEISEWCVSRHTSHVRPGYTRSLCSELAFQVGYLGQEPEDIAWLHGIDLEQAERLLLGALRHGREWREDTTMRLSREPGSEAPTPERRPYKPAA